jgi:hypothetical protein
MVLLSDAFSATILQIRALVHRPFEHAIGAASYVYFGVCRPESGTGASRERQRRFRRRLNRTGLKIVDP